MAEFTLHDLQCFDAVIRAGGLQAAASLLHRSHPSVSAAVAKLERQLNLVLLDRSGYRVQLPRPACRSTAGLNRCFASCKACAPMRSNSQWARKPRSMW
ncbi:LysR family transcriptional regulator [Pseudomonas sp. CFSAN084952]|uniref:helix-turn-helix domain-containing protein n=1 Tax=Pseudomonas TaxID=286 RepID=UPI0021159B8A|nr:LysR family transcriptional regulator [Pseudomonas sp. CFSAN084952]